MHMNYKHRYRDFWILEPIEDAPHAIAFRIPLKRPRVLRLCEVARVLLSTNIHDA